MTDGGKDGRRENEKGWKEERRESVRREERGMRCQKLKIARWSCNY